MSIPGGVKSVTNDDISNRSFMGNKRSFQTDSNINHIFTMCVKSLTLFVPGVSENKTEEDIKQEFAKFGMVTDAHNTGKGCAFVTFEDEECAETAIKEMKEKTILKWKIRVTLGRTANLVSISPEVERLMQEAAELNEGIRPDSTSPF
jgi:RNA recognition motif-containing protein